MFITVSFSALFPDSDWMEVVFHVPRFHGNISARGGGIRTPECCVNKTMTVRRFIYLFCLTFLQKLTPVLALCQTGVKKATLCQFFFVVLEFFFIEARTGINLLLIRFAGIIIILIIITWK